MNLNENIAESEDIDDKIKNRLLKYYKDKFKVKSESSNKLIDFLFNKRDDLAAHQGLIDALCIGRHDQITEFIKNGLKNNFSAQAISKFIVDNGSMFFDGSGQIYSMEIGGEKRSVKLVGSKSSRIMKFLLLVLDISQDKNFRDPKQELTIDYIVELAKNIDDHKDRYKFKILALSYFLPDQNRWFDENNQLHEIDLSQCMIDIKKLFADELSKKNQNIDEKERLEIKRMAIDILTADRDLIRRDVSDLNLGDGSYFKKYCSCAKDGVTNFSYYYLYHVCGGPCFFSQSKVIDDIFDFFEDDIKKSISDKDANNNFFKSNGLLFSHIRLLFGETLLLQKINELIKGNQNAQNDYKIFVLIFALIQNSKSPEFCIDKSIADESKFIDNPYGSYYHNDILKYWTDNLYPELKFKLLFFFYKQLVHVRKNNGKNDVYIDDKLFSEQDKLANIFYPNFHEYICDFCAHYKKDKLDDRIDPVAFSSFAWSIFVNNHNNAYNKHEVLENMLQCVSDQILKDNKAVNPFLYEFLGNMLDRYVYLIKQSEYFRNESVIIFDCFLSLIEKDKNMSAKAKKDINDFVIMLFNPDNLRLYLENRQFVEYLARIIKNDQLNFYLPSQKKYFFVYIKECLKSVINNDPKQNVLTRYKEQKSELPRLGKEISNLNHEINYYKKFYWLKWVPVLGWIGCAILYFGKIKSMENELHLLRSRYDNTKCNVFQMEKLGYNNIENFINPGDNGDKNEKGSAVKIVEKKEKNSLNNDISNTQPLLDATESVK